MNPSNILVALRERNKWVDRRQRLEVELEGLHRKKKEVTDDIHNIKQEIAKLDEAYSLLSSEGAVSRASRTGMNPMR
jgi:chromosome segregation ATPase